MVPELLVFLARLFRDDAMETLRIPTVYRESYDNALAANPELAARYIQHTTAADPFADAVMDALAPFDPGEVNRFINAGMHQDEKALAKAPKALRDFFAEMAKPPAWFDPQALDPGYRAFHQYSDVFMPAFFVCTVHNASTLIAKAFYATGRVMSDFGLRRIRQNTRHFIEIMLPDALEQQGDGWKLSVRLRLVHARIRRLIRESGTWNESVYGVPVSAAHMAFASSNFSAGTLYQAQRLGAKMDAPMRNGFMQAWRYASYLAGTPEEFLFDGSYEKTLELRRVGALCEPTPGEESITIANALVGALPRIIATLDPTGQQGMKAHVYANQEGMTKHVYRVTRALLGNELSDQLRFPPQRTTGFLPCIRSYRRVHGLLHRLAPSLAQRWRGRNFGFLLEASMLEDLRYQLPDHLDAKKATPW